MILSQNSIPLEDETSTLSLEDVSSLILSLEQKICDLNLFDVK